MANGVKCPICDLHANKEAIPDGLMWRCPKCGEFEITGTAEAMLRATPFKTPAAISGWTRLQNSHGMTPRIDSYVLPRLHNYSKPKFSERAERYLVAAVSMTKKLNDYFEATTQELVGISYSDDDREVSVIIEYLKSKNFIIQKPGGSMRVSAEGHIAADELRNRRSPSTQGFVAMWFDETMLSARDNGFVLAIDKAGYTAMVISQKEHVKKIDDEIVAEIRRSAFVVADFTGHRGGVYFEAGFATG